MPTGGRGHKSTAPSLGGAQLSQLAVEHGGADSQKITLITFTAKSRVSQYDQLSGFVNTVLLEHRHDHYLLSVAPFALS